MATSPYKICPICGKKLFSINVPHIRTHGMSMLEFYDKYPQYKEDQFKYGKIFDDKNKNKTHFGKVTPYST